MLAAISSTRFRPSSMETSGTAGINGEWRKWGSGWSRPSPESAAIWPKKAQRPLYQPAAPRPRKRTAPPVIASGRKVGRCRFFGRLLRAAFGVREANSSVRPLRPYCVQ
jgi:hypothetical protein